MALGPIRAGLLRHSVTIRMPTRTDDGHGGFINGWSSLGTFAAMVEGIDGKEVMLASALQGVSSFRVTTRWYAALVSADVTSWQFVLESGRILNVRSCSDPDGRRYRLEFLADTGSVIKDS